MTKKDQPESVAPALENILRPNTLSEYIGQKKVKQSLQLFIDAGRSRGSVSEHILFFGPPGMGKTTLSRILAHELNGDLKVTSGPAIEKTGDLASILTNLNDNDILFIDEIHRLPKPVEEALYPVMEEFALDIVIGKGPAARTVRLSVPKITIIGATTRVALLSAPMRDRFGLILRLENYSHDELETITERSASLLDLPLEKAALNSIALRARGTPRIANRMLKRLRDLQEIKKFKIITEEVVAELFHILDIDAEGLDNMDMLYLKMLIEKFEGGPVGLSTLASSLSEDEQTIEEYIEPYLLRKAFIKKSPRGRVATKKAYEHVGISYQKKDQ